MPADSLASFVNSQIAPEFDWKDAEWLLGEWNGPSAVKGVCRPDDAVRAVETGFTTMWVSNHGARQLETSPATIDVLPSIREAVGPDVEIILGKDEIWRATFLLFVMKIVNPFFVQMEGSNEVQTFARHLHWVPIRWAWANLISTVWQPVSILRAFTSHLIILSNEIVTMHIYANLLFTGGTEGVIKAYNILKTELDRAMGLLGTGTVDELKKRGPGLIKRRHASARDYPDRYAYERGYGGGVI